MKVKKSHVRVTVLCLFYILYLVIGASIFSAIEGPEEKRVVKAMRKTRAKFLKDRPNNCISDTELEAFIVEIIDANNRGVSATNNVSSEPNWSFGQSMFFAGTILTTIGYGHVTPLSEGGKIFCVVYAIIGIPLTLIMFTALVERLMIVTTRLHAFLAEKLGHLYKALHIRFIHLSIIFAFLIVFIFVLPSVIFMLLEEKWNFLDAFYYCFISMTTIGLGDYIPGDKPNQQQRALYKICTTFYLFIGLTVMMLTIANIYEIPELNVGYHFYMRSDEDENERRPIRTSEGGPKYSEQVNAAYQGGERADDRQHLTNASTNGS